MRIVWCTLQFLDYRIPVFEELNKIEGVELYLLFNGDLNAKRIIEKSRKVLGDNSIPLYGEFNIGNANTESFANSGFRLPYQKGLIKKIKDLKPDVMVGDGFFQWSYATLFLSASKNIPHVMCYERTMHTERNAQLIRTKYRKLALRWIDVICCSGSWCEKYIRYLGFKGSITKGFMVADTQTFLKNTETTKKQSKIKDNSIIEYVFVGRLIGLKGIEQLLEAWSIFSKTYSDVILTIIGKGVLEDYIKSKIEEEEIEGINFIGEVDYDSIQQRYLNADIFVLPTLEDNWSLVVPEAMASGLPIITSIYNGCYPELVTSKNGWVMDPLNTNNFVNTLKESYNKRSHFIEMGQKSIEIVKKHNPQNAAKSVYDACRLAINKNHEK